MSEIRWGSWVEGDYAAVVDGLDLKALEIMHLHLEDGRVLVAARGSSEGGTCWCGQRACRVFDPTAVVRWRRGEVLL